MNYPILLKDRDSKQYVYFISEFRGYRLIFPDGKINVPVKKIKLHNWVSSQNKSDWEKAKSYKFKKMIKILNRKDNK